MEISSLPKDKNIKKLDCGFTNLTRINRVSDRPSFSASTRHDKVSLFAFRKCMQLNNQSRPKLFTSSLDVVSYMR